MTHAYGISHHQCLQVAPIDWYWQAFSKNETSTLWSPKIPGAWSQPTGREHELSRAGTTLRPELARSGLLNSMKGKVFQEDRRR
jgi:hypothetical protein